MAYVTMRHILPKLPTLAGKPPQPDFEKKKGGHGGNIPKFHVFAAFFKRVENQFQLLDMYSPFILYLFLKNHPIHNMSFFLKQKKYQPIRFPGNNKFYHILLDTGIMALFIIKLSFYSIYQF